MLEILPNIIFFIDAFSSNQAYRQVLGDDLGNSVI